MFWGLLRGLGSPFLPHATEARARATDKARTLMVIGLMALPPRAKYTTPRRKFGEILLH